MQIKLLSQGYEPKSKNAVGYHLIELLGDKQFHTFTAISAFVSRKGVEGLSNFIEEAKSHLQKITIISGIDQGGTTKEALEALIEMNVEAFVFYQPSNTIFHPKIYLFEGNEKAVLIVGSSNLTGQGLFTNVESSVRMDIDNSEKEIEIIQELKMYYKGLFDLTDPNLKPLTQALIEELIAEKVVPTEAEFKARQAKDKTEAKPKDKKAIYKTFPKRLLAKIPPIFRKTRKKSKYKIEQEIAVKVTGKQSNLLWESNLLTKRDLNIPTGKNTNPTGSMLLKKGKNKNIDQRHFFRDDVFSRLNWSFDTNPNRLHLERTTATFKIYIDEVEQGDFELKLTHNTKTNTKTYQQKNSMTSLSWGKAKSIIAKKELIGKTAKLYKVENNDNHFVLKIS